jgi:hypothetical protein
MGAGVAMTRSVNRRDLAFGALMVLLALFALWELRGYEMGTANQMSTGYMPWLISVSLLSVGAIIVIKALFIGMADDTEPHRWVRPLLGVSAALVLFMLTLDRLGLIGASIALVLVSGAASRDTRPAGLVVWAVALAIGSAAVFVYLIGLPIRLWPK